nr:histidine phosphatase family protein [Actinocrispum wychmicini]
MRHAESENVIGGVAGAVPRAPLTPRGHEQAAAAARALAHEPIVKVYASTALRARQTADTIAATMNLDVATMTELVEVGIGTAEGTVDPVIRAQTAEVLHAWVVHQDLDRRVADGETGHEVLARVSSAFTEIAARHSGTTVAVVGHVATLTVAVSLLCGLGSRVWGTPLAHAEPFLVEWDGQGWSCSAWPTGAV